MSKHIFRFYFLISGFLLIISYNQKVLGQQTDNSSPELWITAADQSLLLKKQPSLEVVPYVQNNLPAIILNPSQTFQTMDGFGYTLTGGSAMLIHQMSNNARTQLLTELFDTTAGIGVSYLRISIGASDLDDHVFSYDDVPEGETDPNLDQFSLNPDKQYLIPVLQQILKINSNILILGSPWSAPTWMKTNHSAIGGSLKPEYYGTYANYFVKYITGMKAEGIPIDAITVQNEPLHPGNNPSMFMPAHEQDEFVKNFLGPAFERNNLKTKIIIYDHNADRPDYPMSILDDTAAVKYIDGSAFHLYGGEIDALTKVHDAHPDKNLYFTEQWIGAPGDFATDLAWHTEQLMIGAPRNWCKTVLQWNLAADPNQNPHTDQGGCTSCLGAITINGDNVTRNPAYYIIAQSSEFVKPGSFRMASNIPDNLPNVAYLTPSGKIAVLVFNKSDQLTRFVIVNGNKQVTVSLNGKSAATVVW